MRVGIVGTGKMGREIETVGGGARPRRRLDARLARRTRDGAGLTPERLAPPTSSSSSRRPRRPSRISSLWRRPARGSSAERRAGRGSCRASREAFLAGDGALVHAANFSIGVRHFFDLATRAARLYAPAGYAAYLVEEHHAEKRDAPSGTARTIAAIVEMETGRPLPVTSVRAGTIPGTHRLVFESPEDEVEIIHRARGRAGFATGAVWAAERIAGRTGVFEFGELLAEVEKEAVVKGPVRRGRLEGVRHGARDAVRREGAHRFRRARAARRLADHGRGSTSSCRAGRRASRRRSRATSARRSRRRSCTAADGRVPVIAGAGGNHTAKAVFWARDAEAAGADGILSVSPMYNKPTRRGALPALLGDLGRDRAPDPRLQRAGADGLGPRRRDDPAAGGDPERRRAEGGLGELRQDRAPDDACCPPDFAVFSGDDSTALALIALGATRPDLRRLERDPGGDERARRRRRSTATGDEARASSRRKWLPLMEMNFWESSPGPVKCALALMKKCGETLRLPLAPVRDDTRRKIETLLACAEAPAEAGRGAPVTPRSRSASRRRPPRRTTPAGGRARGSSRSSRRGLNDGSIRAARSEDGRWVVHPWVKRGILLGFRVGALVAGLSPRRAFPSSTRTRWR